MTKKKPCKVCRSHPMLMLTIDLCNEKGGMEDDS